WRSRATTFPASATSAASTRRCCGPPRATGAPSRRTSTGPRMRNSEVMGRPSLPTRGCAAHRAGERLQSVNNAGWRRVVDDLHPAGPIFAPMSATSQAGPAVLIREPGRAPLRLILGEAAIEVGRDCPGVLLTDPQISRRHLTLECRGDAVRVT